MEHIDWTTQKCADCGLGLDKFGICVMASPEDVAKMRAPVNCGQTPAMAEVFLKTLTAEFIKPQREE